MKHQPVADLRSRQVARQHHTAFALRKYVARLAQRPGHHRGRFVSSRKSSIGLQHTDAVVAAVHRRPHQVVEARIDQHKVLAALMLLGAHFAQQHARFGHQIAARFDLQLQRAAEFFFDAAACGVPQIEVVRGVGGGFAVLVRNGQAAAG